MGSNDPSLLVRAVWFLFVGWWATGIALFVAWILNLTIIGLPLGIKIINRVPKILSLKGRESGVDVHGRGGREQSSLAVRAVYFVFVGWWASGIWMGIAYVLSLSIVGLPLAIVMYNKLPYVTSLYNY